jgi:hypothetical protein
LLVDGHFPYESLARSGGGFRTPVPGFRTARWDDGAMANPLTDGVERLAQAIAERVVNLVVEAIDVDALVARIDVDALIERVDVNALVERVDVERIIERVDVEKVVERIDVNALVERIDIDRIVGQLDIDALVEQTELGAIIAKSTTGVLTEALDLVRSQGVGLDDFVARWTNRLLRRDPASLPDGPLLLVGAPAGGGGSKTAGPSGAAGTTAAAGGREAGRP